MFFVGFHKKMGLVLVFVFFILDRLLKAIATSKIRINWGLGDWLKFNFIGNPNIAFSLPFFGIWLNILVLLVVLSLLVYAVYLWQKKQALELFCLISMILGASSNLYDRFFYGFVIDYIDLKFFTVFNLADVLVVFGVGFLLWLTIKEPQEELDSQQQISS